MDIFKAISDLTTLPGVTGNEAAVSRAVQGYFRAHTDDVWIDAMGNTYGRIGNPDGPTLLVMAHMDEVGMMVTDIEENGMLRLTLCATPGSRWSACVSLCRWATTSPLPRSRP